MTNNEVVKDIYGNIIGYIKIDNHGNKTWFDLTGQLMGKVIEYKKL